MPTKPTMQTAMSMLLANRYPNAPETPEDQASCLRLWGIVLADLDDESFMGAISSLLNGEGVYWPKVGQIRAAVPAARLDAVDDADEAWGNVLNLARRVGRAAGLPENRAKWDSKGAEYGARMWIGIAACGGWEAICNTDARGHGFMRPAFLAAYRSAKARRAIVADAAKVVRLADHAADRKALAGSGGGFKRIGEP